MTGRQDQRRSNERLRHACWSGLIALVLSFFYIIDPVDQLTWAMQARLAKFEASGDVVFVGAEQDLVDPEFPERRQQLARAIENLKEAGADSVYVDAAFDRPSTPESDRALNEAMRSFGSDAYFVRNLVTGLDGRLTFEPLIDSVGYGIRELGGFRKKTYFGYVWSAPYVIEHDGLRLENIAASIGGESGSEGARSFPINYGFERASIPMHRLEQSVAPQLANELAGKLHGKAVVIGNISAQTAFSIPGHINVPGALVHIYAAETILAGHTGTIPGFAVLIAALAIVASAGWARSPWRNALYVLVGLTVPIGFAATAQWGIRFSPGGALAFLFIYAVFRLRARWKNTLRMVDEKTGLPTFAALEVDRGKPTRSSAIIVAKMHRFEEVQKTLSPQHQSEYVLRVIDRLNAASPDTAIFIGPGHLIAWRIEQKDPAVLRDHLEGMRALFAAPLQVGNEQVDAGITFGVDVTPSADVAKRLANAVSAAERTTETYNPILIAEIGSDEELLWNISLQARIDNALANGEIFLNYQPKVLIATGEMVGVEALLRWRDPVRGMIPPDSFIRQCEDTGRMAHVTRHVLAEACRAGNRLAAEGAPLSIAVNISATMLHERSIVTMVGEVLAETKFAPERLTLEITETSRISDLDLAAGILRDLVALGPRISMDDFGVGAASLEALLRLPFVELKIDRLFISRMTEDPKALGIVRSILMLGRQLRTVVVAEGVEDSATMELLREGGCRVAQGYGIQRPTTLDQIVQFRDKASKPNAILTV